MGKFLLKKVGLVESLCCTSETDKYCMSTIIKNEFVERGHFGGRVDDGLEQDDHQCGEGVGCRDGPRERQRGLS